MSMTEILTTGITGIVCGALLVFITVNMCKAGWMGKASRWITSAKDDKAYGGRVLTMSVCTSAVINLIQWAAISSQGEYTSFWMILLRTIACALLASGGYEYIKTIVQNLPESR